MEHSKAPVGSLHKYTPLTLTYEAHMMKQTFRQFYLLFFLIRINNLLMYDSTALTKYPSGHRKLNNHMGRPHPRISNLIKCLKSEAQKYIQNIVRMELKLESTKRTKKHTKLDERIVRHAIRYEEVLVLQNFSRLC